MDRESSPKQVEKHKEDENQAHYAYTSGGTPLAMSPVSPSTTKQKDQNDNQKDHD